MTESPEGIRWIDAEHFEGGGVCFALDHSRERPAAPDRLVQRRGY